MARGVKAATYAKASYAVRIDEFVHDDETPAIGVRLTGGVWIFATASRYSVTLPGRCVGNRGVELVPQNSVPEAGAAIDVAAPGSSVRTQLLRFFTVS